MRPRRYECAGAQGTGSHGPPGGREPSRLRVAGQWGTASGTGPRSTGGRARRPGERDGNSARAYRTRKTGVGVPGRSASLAPMRKLLRYFVAARALSILGDRIADVALPLAVLTVSGSAFTAGLVGAAAQLPQVLLALPVGALVDRRERRGLMVTADLVRAVAFVAIGAEVAFGGARPVSLVPLALLVGLADAVFHTAAGSCLPHLVTDRDLMRANGYVEGSDAAATLTGPAAGGWLLQSLGPLAAFAVNAASFLGSALLLVRLPRNSPTRDGSGADPSVLAGLRLVCRDPEQRALLGGACYAHLLAATAFLPLLVRADGELGLTPLTTGLVVAAAGVGGLVSSLVLARYCDTARWPLLLAVVLAVNGGATGLLALFEAPLWLAGAVLVLDGASALAFVVVATTRQRVTPDLVRGRVLAASTAVTATVRLLGIASVGALIDSAGPRPVLVALAVLALPCVLLLTVSGSSHPAEPPSATTETP
ncbi:MFS transporter [Streptomyces sp. NPDC005438]|uniref:MFS transporter n=1 Tax=Streptomyces sp. NPDC005438 TaxID=3156880 RepID=UPI0033BAA03D